MWLMNEDYIMICSWITCSWVYSDSEDSFDFHIEIELYIKNAEIGKSLKSDWWGNSVSRNVRLCDVRKHFLAKFQYL